MTKSATRALFVVSSVVATSVLASCALVSSGSPATPPAAPPPSPSAIEAMRIEEARIADRVIVEANVARVREGRDSLVAVEDISRVATEYAHELAARRLLDHKSGTGGKEDAGARLHSARVQWKRVGENLAMFSPRTGVGEATVIAWLNSPGHRHNLLDPLFHYTGAGVARDFEGNYYIVQMYVTQ